MISYFLDRSFVARRKLLQLRAEAWLTSHPELRKELEAYTKQSGSTGCNSTDYWALYKHIRNSKPREVLELGIGTSTLVIAYALEENRRDSGVLGRVTSMEESPFWVEKAIELLPRRYSNIVDICLSDTKEDFFSIFRGICYKDIPLRAYDFVYVDGPTTRSPVDGSILFDIDLINIIGQSDRPISAIIDKRVSTCFVFQQIFGAEKVKYDPVFHLGFIDGCSKHDLGSLPRELSSINFNQSFNLFRKTRLFMNPVGDSAQNG